VAARDVIPVSGALAAATRRHSTADVLRGWSPFIVASVLIFVTGLPAAARYLNFDALRMPMPFLHNAVLKMPPVAPQPTPEDATVNLNFIALPGSVVFVAGVIAALLARLPLATTVRLFKDTVVQMTPSLLAISFMVGLAYVTRYSGMDTILGLSLTGTGWLFPFFGTLLGWLGVALDRDRCRFERALRQPAEGDRGAARPESDPDGRGQHHRRRDGQDDRRAIDRRGELRHASAGTRGGDLQGRLLAQHRAGLARRPDRDGVRLRRTVGDSVATLSTRGTTMHRTPTLIGTLGALLLAAARTRRPPPARWRPTSRRPGRRRDRNIAARS
jgi:hypothetical protein